MAGQQSNPGVSLAGVVDLGALKHQVKTKPGQTGGAPTAGGYVIDTTENAFQVMARASATPLILLLLRIPTDDRLFLVARMLGDMVNALSGQIQLSRINILSNPSIVQVSQVQSAPALFTLIANRLISLSQDLPDDDELKQLTDEVIPGITEAAAQSGVNGTAPCPGDPDSDTAKNTGATGTVVGAEQVPPRHAKAHHLTREGDYAGAAAEYERVPGSDPLDTLTARERAKALLLTRSGVADVHGVCAATVAAPGDVETQLAVADTDIVGGQIQDAFDCLLDFLAAGYKADIGQVRKRLLEYFAIPEPTDPRLTRAHHRLATLIY